jgi:hypothetical protein
MLAATFIGGLRPLESSTKEAGCCIHRRALLRLLTASWSRSALRIEAKDDSRRSNEAENDMPMPRSAKSIQKSSFKKQGNIN